MTSTCWTRLKALERHMFGLETFWNITFFESSAFKSLFVCFLLKTEGYWTIRSFRQKIEKIQFFWPHDWPISEKYVRTTFKIYFLLLLTPNWVQNCSDCFARTNFTTQILLKISYMICKFEQKKMQTFWIFTQNFLKFWNFICSFAVEILAESSTKNILLPIF